MNTKLTCFFYLLMRDHLPCGTVAEIVSKLTEEIPDEFYYSNIYLADYSISLLRKLGIESTREKKGE